MVRPGDLFQILMAVKSSWSLQGKQAAEKRPERYTKCRERWEQPLLLGNEEFPSHHNCGHRPLQTHPETIMEHAEHCGRNQDSGFPSRFRKSKKAYRLSRSSSANRMIKSALLSHENGTQPWA